MTPDPLRATILKAAAALCRGNFTPDEEDASGALLDRLHEASKVTGLALRDALEAVDAEVKRLRILLVESDDRMRYLVVQIGRDLWAKVTEASKP